VRLGREQARLSQRELGRRIAARLGRQDAGRALQVRLSRIESRDEIAEADRDLVDALAAELALGTDDLGEAPYYVWLRQTGGVPTFVALGLRQLLYTSPEKAFDSRDALALRSEGAAKPTQDADPVPLRRGALSDILEANFGPELSEHERDTLVAIDPDVGTMLDLYVLQRALGDDLRARDAVAQGAIDEPAHLFELVVLHELATRRLQRAQEGELEQVAAASEETYRQFAAEEEALMDILDRAHQLRHERRASV
jgi:hypothetical protein